MKSSNNHSAEDRAITYPAETNGKQPGIKRTYPIYVMTACTFFIYGWLFMYVSNYTKLWFAMKDVFLFSLLPAIAFITFCLMINRILPERGKAWFSALLFGLGLAMFIQGTYLNNDYGLLDGTTINWDNYVFRGVISIGTWILSAALPLVIVRIKKGEGVRFLATLSIFIIFAELIPLGLQIATNKAILQDETEKLTKTHVLTDEDRFLLSTSENTIVFCLDAFDCAYMEEILDENPEYAETFDGFTIFTNVVSTTVYTQLAIPAILTDEVYHNDFPYPEYIQRSYEGSPLLNTLENRGAHIGVYTDNMFVGKTEVIDNQHIVRTIIVKPVQFVKYMSMFAAFRFMPQPLKPLFIFTNNNFDLCRGLSDGFSSVRFNDFMFHESLVEDGLEKTVDEPVFRFYHLLGAHEPYTLNARMERVKNSTAREQARGVLRIVEIYLNTLREKDLFDCSNVIIMADHGYLGLRQRPLLMVKRANENHALQMNDAPISYSLNLMPTLLSMVSSDNANVENTVFGVLEIANVERAILLPLDKIVLDPNYYYTLYEFSTLGHAFDAMRFQPTGTYYSAGNKSIGVPVQFNRKIQMGNVLKNTLEGWGGDQANVYSMGDTSIFALALHELPRRDLILSVNVDMVMLWPGELSCYIGNQYVGTDRASADRDTLSFRIPKSMIPDNGVLLLSFRPKLPENLAMPDLSGLWTFRWDSILLQEANDADAAAAEIPKSMQLVPRVLDNADLDSDNSTVILHENGVRHGYYIALPEGTYQMEIRGSHLKDVVCYIKSELMNSMVELECKDDTVRIQFSVNELTKDCNFNVCNFQPYDVYVSSVILSKTDK